MSEVAGRWHKSHYIAMARFIATLPEPHRTNAVRYWIAQFSETNRRFDPTRFATASGIDPENRHVVAAQPEDNA